MADQEWFHSLPLNPPRLTPPSRDWCTYRSHTTCISLTSNSSSIKKWAGLPWRKWARMRILLLKPPLSNRRSATGVGGVITSIVDIISAMHFSDQMGPSRCMYQWGHADACIDPAILWTLIICKKHGTF